MNTFRRYYKAQLEGDFAGEIPRVSCRARKILIADFVRILTATGSKCIANEVLESVCLSIGPNLSMTDFMSFEYFFVDTIVRPASSAI